MDELVALWRAAHTARAGQPPAEGSEEKVRATLAHPSTFVVTETADGLVVGFAAAMQGMADDGAGRAVPGLCHVGLVFVDPRRWGRGTGGRVLDAVLGAARERGYERAQLWTPLANERGDRLYVSRGFAQSGRRMVLDGVEIAHYKRAL